MIKKKLIDHPTDKTKTQNKKLEVYTYKQPVIY